MRARTVAVLAAVFVAGAAAGAGAVLAAARPAMRAEKKLDLTTTELRGRMRVTLNIDHWDPAAETREHRHPGPTIFYVLDGELEETSPEGVRTLKAGDAVWNAANRPHNVKNRGAASARALAVHLDPVR